MKQALKELMRNYSYLEYMECKPLVGGKEKSQHHNLRKSFGCEYLSWQLNRK